MSKKKHKLTLFEIADQDEIEFLIRLNASLDLTIYEIKRTNRLSKYYPVDYEIYKNGELVLHLELKSRYDLTHYVNYDKTLMIGKTKLLSIKERFKKTIIIWQCKTNKYVWFSRFRREFNDLPTEYCNNSPVQMIPIEKCKIGFDALIEDLLDYIEE